MVMVMCYSLEKVVWKTSSSRRISFHHTLQLLEINRVYICIIANLYMLRLDLHKSLSICLCKYSLIVHTPHSQVAQKNYINIHVHLHYICAPAPVILK